MLSYKPVSIAFVLSISMAGKSVSATEKKVADAQPLKSQSSSASKKTLTYSAESTNDPKQKDSHLNGEKNGLKQQSANDTELTESLPSEAFLLFLADAIDVNGEVTDVLDMEEVEDVVSDDSEAPSNNQSKSDELKQKDVKIKPDKKNTTSSLNRVNPKLSEEK